jgi:hypothetical protein
MEDPAVGRAPAPPRGRRIDLVAGVALGVVLGLAIIAIFVFVFSEDTVDAPSLEHGKAPVERPVDR